MDQIIDQCLMIPLQIPRNVMVSTTVNTKQTMVDSPANSKAILSCRLVSSWCRMARPSEERFTSQRRNKRTAARRTVHEKRLPRGSALYQCVSHLLKVAREHMATLQETSTKYRPPEQVGRILGSSLLVVDKTRKKRERQTDLFTMRRGHSFCTWTLTP